jgi:hypothetical protein
MTTDRPLELLHMDLKSDPAAQQLVPSQSDGPDPARTSST